MISICLTCGKIKHKSSKSTTRGKYSGVRHVLLGDLRQGAELLCTPVSCTWASLVAQMVKKKKKNLPVTWETWVRSLGWEDPVEIPRRRAWQSTPVILPGESSWT